MDFEENMMAVFFLFSFINTVVKFLGEMWCQLNSESCLNSSWKPHREKQNFFLKSQNLFTVKPGDRENLLTVFTFKKTAKNS